MNVIAIKAKALRDQERQEHERILKEKADAAELLAATTLKNFEDRFEFILEDLKRSGISYSAKMKNINYEFQGFYIEFKYKGKILKMDFENIKSYRYEYANPDETGSMTFGHWPDEGFILFLADGFHLLDEEKGQKTEENVNEPELIEFTRDQFEDWHEAHYEISVMINEEVMNDFPKCKALQEESKKGGMGRLWEISKQLSDEFTKQYENELWEERTFFEVLESFFYNHSLIK